MKRRRNTSDVAAEAMARSELTPKGQRDCVWKLSWAPRERREWRRLARIALRSAKEYRATL